MTPQQILKDAEHRMQQAVEATGHDFSHIRTGRANPLVLEPITIDYYGVDTPINQVGQITVPEARQLLIKPYEKSILGAIEKAIQASDLGVNPQNDGETVRLVFPEMTEERRKEMVKQVHERGEQGCVAVRNVRRDANHHLAAAGKEGGVGEDEIRGHEKKVQDLTDKFVAKIHELQEKKEQELMTI